MRTSTHRAIAITLLSGAIVVGGAAAAGTVRADAAAPTLDEAVADAAFLDWRVRRDVHDLPDGSVLTVYAGETAARDGRDARLRVGFVPRFGCAPGIEFVVGEVLAARLSPVDPGVGDRAGGLVDDDEARVMVDGTPVGYPVLVDALADGVALAFNGNERERITLRLQLDIGDVVRLGLGDAADSLAFSLLGSRRTLAAAESLCLTHPPVEPAADAG